MTQKDKDMQEKIFIIIFAVVAVVIVVGSIIVGSIVLNEEEDEPCIIKKSFINYTCQDGRKGFVSLLFPNSQISFQANDLGL